MRTARQVDLLRTEVGNGLSELRTAGEALRTELLQAVTEGLRGHSEALAKLAGERQEAELAHRDNRKLQRQLAETRDELHRVRLLAAEAGTVRTTAAAGADAANAPDRLVTGTGASEDPSAEPRTGPPEPTAAEAPLPETRCTLLKETAVPDNVPAEESNSPKTGITAEQANQILELLGRLVPASAPASASAPDAATAPAPQQRPAGQGVPIPSAATGGVTDLIPAALAWNAHVATLLKAAAVNTVAVSCNPRTWEFLEQRVEGAEHFAEQDLAPRPRGSAGEDHGDNILSGRSVIALLNALRTAVYAGTGQEVETWALAVTCYERIAEVVNATRPGGDGQEPARPRIVLDDLSVRSAG
ncbi:hypothetical protein ACGF07_03770 [Kitasatospora sp. NPDC048194]|uniref:hypothetical protein n=1 Tax=Kitasatospora sp. NPDC048194 TaxID=3364045 RepID=UPI003712E997